MLYQGILKFEKSLKIIKKKFINRSNYEFRLVLHFFGIVKTSQLS